MRYLTGRASTRCEVVDMEMPSRTNPDHDRLGLGCWVGFAGESFIGWYGLAPRHEPSTFGLGYRLRRGAWGHGYAVEGARAVLAHGFGLGVQRVVAETMAVNTRSRGVTGS